MLPDDTRSADLRRMKASATAMLVAATAVFVAFRFVGDEAWRGYVETAAEAAMVGGLADWFAVTALFRRPLGLPIPHTAIIPTRKDQIGASLGSFVEENFLDADLLADRVTGMAIGERLAAWLGHADNSRIIAARAADGLVALTELLDDDAVQELVQSFVQNRLRRTSAAPVLARALDAAVAGGQHQAAIEAVLRGVERAIVDNEALFRRRIHDGSPWWLPAAVDDRIFAKLVAGLRSLIDDVLAQPDHELRHHVGARIADLAHRLRTDAALQERVDRVRDELLERPELQSWLRRIWSDLESDLRAASADPASSLHQRLDSMAKRLADRLADDGALRARVDRYAARIARYAAQTSGSEVSELIAATVARWDADDTSRRIELQVGRDLQYIRINGTVVGALAGVAIHAVAQLIG